MQYSLKELHITIFLELFSCSSIIMFPFFITINIFIRLTELRQINLLYVNNNNN